MGRQVTPEEELKQKQCCGIKVSVQLWKRKKKKAKISQGLRAMTNEDMIAQLKQAEQEYSKAKKDHKNSRLKFLDTISANDIDCIKCNKAACEMGRIAKQATRRLASKSVTKVEVNGEECTSKQAMEEKLLEVNYAKIRASDDTVFMQQPLLSEFRYRENTLANDQVLDGTYEPHEATDPHAKILLEGLAMPAKIRAQCRAPPPRSPRTGISTDDHIKAWRKAKEMTSAGMSGLHFGMYEAHTRRCKLAELDASCRSVCYRAGFAYKRWRWGLDVQLLKRSMDYRIEKLRTILLLEADFNMNNKALRQDAMRAGERVGVHARDNLGGQKRMRAVEFSMNQLLTYNSIFGRRGRAILMSNNAAGCYDRIAHIIVNLALQRLGIPKPPLQSMLTTIQEMDHYVQTAFGDSDNSYGNYPEDPLPQGILQSNGAGPAGWFAISTVLINALHQTGLGYMTWSLIRRRMVKITCFAFVDDTDLIHSNDDPAVTPSLISEAQESLHTWECLL